MSDFELLMIISTDIDIIVNALKKQTALLASSGGLFCNKSYGATAYRRHPLSMLSQRNSGKVKQPQMSITS